MSVATPHPVNETTTASSPIRRKPRWWARILLSVVAVIGVLLVVVALQPPVMTVTRSATFAAPPAEVFAQVNDFHNWEAWSPWAKLDPAAKNTFEGPSSGNGAMFSWDGNDQVGAGRMTISESRPDELIHIKLHFIRPFEGTDDVEFKFQPEGDQTRVTWTMTGQKNFICKAMGLVMDMDKMLGGEFEKGLANMQRVVEAAP